MQPWAKVIAVSSIDVSKEYFLARQPYQEAQELMFLARDIHGKLCTSIKPGIAVRVLGKDVPALIVDLTDRNPDVRAWVIIEIPANADKRWKRRTKRRY